MQKNIIIAGAVILFALSLQTICPDMQAFAADKETAGAAQTESTEAYMEKEKTTAEGSQAASETLSVITQEQTIQTYNCTLSDSTMEAIQAAIDAYDGIEVEFTMVDLFTGQAVAYNAQTTMYSASAIKGPYIISVLCAGYPKDSNMYNAIVYSDNAAYEACVDTYGKEIFSEWLSSCEAESTTFRGRYADTTSLDLARMWTKAYDFFTSEMDSARWASIVFQASNCSAISQALPQYTVYSKAGWIDEGDYYNVYTNAGIVMDDSHPYVISIMSRCTGTAGIPETEQLAQALDLAHWEMMGENPSQYIQPDNRNITYEVYVASLKVLKGPEKTTPCLGVLSEGTKIKVLEISENYWGKIEYNGQVGWVCLTYCRK